ncbi:uncharacterized protein EI97DRAFT_437775 [Westerdykella ornata]|uniref:Uncharacterized protein n=1 Tax=Westerdykella ornata TaxID=318751 RepID=A0A6A6J508_WESOR|nr:uncharacterized protein EI97DRAFT_437775 [Westerdykella ornata]KAF2271525.1 hypothetical protein EI97DRAFT_437775 [Westerdykella ornata]
MRSAIALALEMVNADRTSGDGAHIADISNTEIHLRCADRSYGGEMFDFKAAIVQDVSVDPASSGSRLKVVADCAVLRSGNALYAVPFSRSRYACLIPRMAPASSCQGTHIPFPIIGCSAWTRQSLALECSSQSCDKESCLYCVWYVNNYFLSFSL